MNTHLFHTAWEALEASVAAFDGKPISTVAARTILSHPEKIAPLIFKPDKDIMACALRVGRQY
ncbi:MAG: hypothetical protein R6T92_10450 [Desulfosalsimonadaceae bacterium]